MKIGQESRHPPPESGLIGGCLVWYDPWVLIPVQHIFLLCGYALVPLAFRMEVKFVGKGAWNKTDFHVPLSKEEWRTFAPRVLCIF